MEKGVDANLSIIQDVISIFYLHCNFQIQPLNQSSDKVKRGRKRGVGSGDDYC